MTGDIILGTVDHAACHKSVGMRVVVVDDPFAFFSQRSVIGNVVDRINELVGRFDVSPVQLFRDGAQGYNRLVEQQKLVDGRRGVADHHVSHEHVFGYLVVVHPFDGIMFGSQLLVFLNPISFFVSG